jgi:hypothetical protein
MSIKSVGMSTQDDADWVRTVRQSVAALRYGSVEVLVHDGRVVQVETRRKVRFADDRRADERRRIQEPTEPADRSDGGAAPEETTE